MKLILDLPYYLVDHLKDYSDGENIIANFLCNESYASLFKKKGSKERWLTYIPGDHFDASPEALVELTYKYQPKYIFTPFSYASSPNILAVERFKAELDKRNMNPFTVCRWAGAIWELQVLKHLSNIIGIPFQSFRDKALRGINSQEFHFFGYKYKDELNRLKPSSLTTSVPIRAAALGINLRERQRRPKGLPEFNFNQRLNYKEQLELTITNIKYIKEGTEWE